MKRARMYSLGLSLLIFSLSLNAQQPKIKDAVYRTTTTAAPANTIKGAQILDHHEDLISFAKKAESEGLSL